MLILPFQGPSVINICNIMGVLSVFFIFWWCKADWLRPGCRTGLGRHLWNIGLSRLFENICLVGVH
jgi:hypothetical protein